MSWSQKAETPGGARTKPDPQVKRLPLLVAGSDTAPRLFQNFSNFEFKVAPVALKNWNKIEQRWERSNQTERILKLYITEPTRNLAF